MYGRRRAYSYPPKVLECRSIPRIRFVPFNLSDNSSRFCLGNSVIARVATSFMFHFLQTWPGCWVAHPSWNKSTKTVWLLFSHATILMPPDWSKLCKKIVSTTRQFPRGQSVQRPTNISDRRPLYEYRVSAEHNLSFQQFICLSLEENKFLSLHFPRIR
jgi:hypothetical protein